MSFQGRNVFQQKAFSKRTELFSEGEILSAEKLNRLVQPFNDAQVPVTSSREEAAPTLQVEPYLFTGFGTDTNTDWDWLLATKLHPDGVNFDTRNTRIALPFLLRRSPFDGGTRAGISYTYTDNVTRDADDGGGAVQEIIVPSFEVGDIIFAVRTRPHTRVRIDRTDATSGWVPYLMLNDGRMWSRDAMSSGGT